MRTLLYYTGKTLGRALPMMPLEINETFGRPYYGNCYTWNY
jgi:hypothetical protein